MKRIIVLVSLLLLPPAGFIHSQRTLTLEECRNLAISNNKDLQIAGEKVRIAGNEQKAAFTKYFPQVSATGAYMWNQKDMNLLDMGALRTAIGSSLGGLAQLPIVDNLVSGIDKAQHLDIQNVWIGSVSLVQPVFMGGKIVSYNQITRYAKQLAESMNNTQLQEVIYRTDETYWQVISLVNKKKLADSYVELLHKMDSDVAALIAEGVATEADGLSVRVKLNEAEMAQTKVDNGVALCRMLLAQICGLSLNEPIALADENIADFPQQEPDVKANINAAFMNRNELKSLELAGNIYKKKENIVLSEMLPSVALAANYMITNPNLQNGFKNEYAGMFNVGVIVKVPLSGWWEGSYKRNSARAETHIKAMELQDARERIELQVTQSAYKVNEAYKKLTASSRHMQQADQNLSHANYGFEEGVIPALNLMEAQTAWVSAHSDLIDAQIEVKLAEVYLSKALGTLAPEKQHTNN